MTTCPSIRSMWFLITLVGLSCGEIYTSMMNVKQAILVEKELIQHLKVYIEHETQRLNDIKRFYTKVSDLHNGVYSVLATATANPLVAFTLVKRLQSEWLNVVYSEEAQENAQALRSVYRRMEDILPKVEDLQGAAQGLMRLQDVYALHMEGLVRGHFQRVSNGNAVDIYRPSVSTPLSGDDCFLVGKVAYDVEDYYHSVQWLEEAVRLFRGVHWSPEHEGTLEDALDHLAFSHFKTGNISHALSLSQELLRRDPMNQRVLLNVEKYERLLVESPPLSSPVTALKRPSTTHLSTRNTYERLCQTQGSQPKHYENPRLFCDYFTNGSPGLLLQPIRREVISFHPYVVLFHHFLSDAEAQSVKDLALPGLRRSVVASGEKQATAEYRISKSAWLKDTAHRIVGKVDKRIAMLTGLNVQLPYGEHLQVVNYGIGGHYEPHFDHATSDSSPLYSLKSGNRLATFMIMVPSFGGTSIVMARGIWTLCMLAAQCLLEINGLPTSGCTSTGRNSTGAAAVTPRSEERRPGPFGVQEPASATGRHERAGPAGRQQGGGRGRDGRRVTETRGQEGTACPTWGFETAAPGGEARGRCGDGARSGKRG